MAADIRDSADRGCVAWGGVAAIRVPSLYDGDDDAATSCAAVFLILAHQCPAGGTTDEIPASSHHNRTASMTRTRPFRSRTPRLDRAAAFVLSAMAISCRPLPPAEVVRVDTVRVVRSDTIHLTRLDTVRVSTLPSPAPDPAELMALRRQLESERSAAARYRTAARIVNARLDTEIRQALARDSLIGPSADSARIDGYREMTEGVEYAFALSLARNMVLPNPILESQQVLEVRRVPPLADSARVCLRGDGFTIRATEPTDSAQCSVQKLATRSQRQWSWRVTPDSIDRAQFKDPVERLLVFTVTSYANATEPEPQIVYPVKVRVRERPLPTRISEFLKTSTGLVTLLAGLMTAVGSLWAAMKFGERRRLSVPIPSD